MMLQMKKERKKCMVVCSLYSPTVCLEHWSKSPLYAAGTNVGSLISTTLSVCRELFSNGIYTGLLSVGQYPALIWQAPMNAMCWLESTISHGTVIIHPAKPGVPCILRQVERISRELFC